MPLISVLMLTCGDHVLAPYQCLIQFSCKIFLYRESVRRSGTDVSLFEVLFRRQEKNFVLPKPIILTFGAVKLAFLYSPDIFYSKFVLLYGIKPFEVSTKMLFKPLAQSLFCLCRKSLRATLFVTIGG